MRHRSIGMMSAIGLRSGDFGEAMKMEMPVTAPTAGTITYISVGAGEQVASGQVLAHIG